MRLLFIGFGVVGQGLTRLLLGGRESLRDNFGFAPTITGVVTGSHGSLAHPAGLDMEMLLSAAAAGGMDHYPQRGGLLRDEGSLALIQASLADVLVEVSPTNLVNAQPALDTCRAALDQGMHLVLANKGPVCLAAAALEDQARQRGRQLRYEATVMAGTPTMHLAEDALAGCEILSARGILNSTTNYILTQMESGMSYEGALKQAQELGYAETDPTGDVEGWDAAGKVLILANALFGASLTMADLDVSGISHISAADIAEARAAGCRYKLIASATAEGGMVKAARLPLADPLASVGGSTNAITMKTDLLGDITLIGAGAGKLETGGAILADLLAIQRAAGPS